MFTVKQYFESCGTADNGCSKLITTKGSKEQFYWSVYEMVTGVKKDATTIRNLDHLAILLHQYAAKHAQENDDIIFMNDQSGHKVGHAEFLKLEKSIDEASTFVVCYYAGESCEKIAYHEFVDKGTDVVGVYMVT
jgi:hypothetical protein